MSHCDYCDLRVKPDSEGRESPHKHGCPGLEIETLRDEIEQLKDLVACMWAGAASHDLDEESSQLMYEIVAETMERDESRRNQPVTTKDADLCPDCNGTLQPHESGCPNREPQSEKDTAIDASKLTAKPKPYWTIIEELGNEVTWEVLGTDGGWCVWASHGGGDPDDDFKFTACEPTLRDAVVAVAEELYALGPDWIRSLPEKGND